MVLINCENKKYKGKTGEKSYKIKGKRLVPVGKDSFDLSLNSTKVQCLFYMTGGLYDNLICINYFYFMCFKDFRADIYRDN